MNGNIISALRRIGGCVSWAPFQLPADSDVSDNRIQFSVCSGIIIAATFIPRGAFSINPRIIGDIRLEGEPVDAIDGEEDRESNDSEKDADPSPVVGV
jgi:hypothetical protein